MTIMLRATVPSGIVAALACFALPLVMVSSAGAASAWLAPTTVSGVGSQAGEPQVAFDKHGDAMAVWSSEDGTEANGARKYEVQSAYRPAGEAWQAPETLSLPDQGAEDESMALDGQGDAVAVWEAYTGVTFVVEASYRPMGGTWQTPVYLSPEEIPGTARPEVAVDAQGDAIAIWNQGGPYGGPVWEAFRPADGIWQVPVEVTAGQYGDRPQVAFDKQGDALALWQGFEGTPVNEWVPESAFMPAGGAWQAPVNVAASGIAEGLHLAYGGNGDAVAVWDRWTHGFLSNMVAQAAFRPAGGAWQAPVDLSEEVPEGDEPSNRESREPVVAVDEQGNAVVVWGRWFGAQAAFRPAGGAWQAPVDISAPLQTAESPEVAFDARGDAIAIWALQPSPGSTRIIQTASKPAGGAWQTPVNIGQGGRPQVAFDGQGDAVTIWGANGTIQSAGYVAVGPSLNGLSIPTAGTVGRPVSLSVSPLEVWSVLGETNWNFGDGTSATGTSVTHTYTSAGSYEVQVRSTDMFGNSTSASGTITVAPEPPVSTSASSSSPSLASSAPAPEPPTIGAASQSGSTWRESGKSPVGTTFSVSLNEQATMSLSFLRGVSGRMVGHRCVGKPSKGVKRGCIRTVVAGMLSIVGRRGMNKVAFEGRISRSDVLSPGRYKLVVTATNAAGSSTPRILYFTIIK